MDNYIIINTSDSVGSIIRTLMEAPSLVWYVNPGQGKEIRILIGWGLICETREIAPIDDRMTIMITPLGQRCFMKYNWKCRKDQIYRPIE